METFLIVVWLWFNVSEPPARIHFVLPPETTQEVCIAHVDPLLRRLSQEMKDVEKIYVACMKSSENGGKDQGI